MTFLENSKQYDPVRPGEQWFFYWKTSASLWESRILQFPQGQTIFIPIYWGFHAESSSEWDFGRIQSERDLLRLVQLLTHHNRNYRWILPLTPAPFLPNGGVPASVARTLSVSREGIHLCSFDSEGILNKVYSFFEPKVFQSYSSFLHSFGSFLATNKIKSQVWGASFAYHQQLENISFHEDTSLAFEQGFSRYLKQNHPDGTDLTDPKKESELKQIFSKQVADLFRTTAEAVLAPFWAGRQTIVCLGSGPSETILRSLSEGKSQLEYTRDLFFHFSDSSWVSSALLSPEEKKEPLTWILKEHFGPSEIKRRYLDEIHSQDSAEEFHPYGLVDLFGGKKSQHFRRIGLESYLDKHYRWLYQFQDEVTFTPEWIDSNQHKVKIFHGADLNRVTFAQLLKLFMMGQRVLLDISGLGEGLEKKLHIFLMENDIRSQSVNFMTLLTLCELGEGRLILYSGEQLIENPGRYKFWSHIFQYFNLDQPEVQLDKDVFSLWRIRRTTPHELTYLDVRRVNLYNPTSYKKAVTIRTHKHFAFMRMIDPTRASARSTLDGVDVELLPNGKIALDFGHYEEAR